MLPAFSPIQIRIGAGVVDHRYGLLARIWLVTTRPIRGATAWDTTGLAGASGTTRKLQVVTPWSANIGGIGNFGLFPLPLGFGGVQVD